MEPGVRATTRGVSVGALVPYPLNAVPSQRFRLEQWLARLEAEGIRVELLPFADARLMGLLYRPGWPVSKSLVMAQAVLRRLVAIPSLGKYDAVVVHRAATLVGPALLERAVAWRRPLIFDFDDAIFLSHTTSVNRGLGWLKFPGKTASICRVSTHVVVGNEYLGAYARRYNSRVTVVPSSVDTDRYCPRAKRQAGPLVVGWMGTSTSQTHLELFAPVLRALSERWSMEIRVVSDRRPVLPGVRVAWRAWTLESEVEELQDFDIGIMPMPDDPWAQGKCAMKALLYMAVGVPVVCSAVGMNREVVRHGENGLVAGSPQEWIDCFGALMDDPRLRKRLGEAGRETVASRYSTRQCASLFGQVVRQALGEMPR